MAFLLRLFTAVTVTPVRRCCVALARGKDALLASTSQASSIVSGGIEFLRRDRTAAASSLVALGPVLLRLAQEDAVVDAVQHAAECLEDLIALLQQEEIDNIAAAVRKRHIHTTRRCAVLHRLGV